jgi:DNA repair photolyase
VRWDGQTIEADEEGRLPGFADTAVVRRFDAPEALDTRFHEIRSRSALNRVPGGSRVPFRWTINPYRGCTHACVYCSWGDTLVLMGNGGTTPIRHVRPGDQIYGTERRGAYRRYVLTRVLDHWMVRKPAYRVTLENGTELVTSGDHRFLTRRGWKHVIGAEQGPLQRPHLTLNSKLMGTGAFAEGPIENADYKRGYLCGVIRGDGHLSTRPYLRRDGRTEELNRFRLALTDFEAVARVQVYLDEVGIDTTNFRFSAAEGRYREVQAIRTGRRASIAAIREHIAWPRRTSDDWYKGFLAGIFDAEGTFSSHIVRICNTDPTMIDWITFACRRLGLPFTVERVRDAMWNVRIHGGLEQQLRFFHLTDPAITRKRSIQGRAVKSQSKLRVIGIEPLGIELPLYDITTGTGDFIGDGVIHHNCFARPTHEYLDFDAGRDFEKEIVVKVNVPEVLRKELARPSWKREHVAMGTNTDPYQWVEGRYKLMRGIWAALRDAANPCSVLTKSPLLLRDLDLMLEVAERTEISACLSVPTLEEKAWRASEPHTPHPRARLEAVAKLNAAGIPTGILIAPLLPGINDAPEQVEEIIALATEAGAVSIGGQTLFLHGAVREIYFAWLRSYRPDLVPRYERLFARGGRVPQRERRAIERAAGLPRMRSAPDRERSAPAGERSAPAAERFAHRGAAVLSPGSGAAPREEVRQESLF